MHFLQVIDFEPTKYDHQLLFKFFTKSNLIFILSKVFVHKLKIRKQSTRRITILFKINSSINNFLGPCFFPIFLLKHIIFYGCWFHYSCGLYSEEHSYCIIHR